MQGRREICTGCKNKYENKYQILCVCTAKKLSADNLSVWHFSCWSAIVAKCDLFFLFLFLTFAVGNTYSNFSSAKDANFLALPIVV